LRQNTIVLLIAILSFSLLFPASNSYADSTFVSEVVCEDNFWHVKTYEIFDKEPYSKLFKDVTTTKECDPDDDIITVEGIEVVIECKDVAGLKSWWVVTYDLRDTWGVDNTPIKPPKKLSEVNTNSPCDIPDDSLHITGAVGKVLLVKHVCKGEFWHVVTLDITNPDAPLPVDDIKTSHPCSDTPQDPNADLLITKLECWKTPYPPSYYLVTYRQVPDEKPQPFGAGIATGIPCETPPYIPSDQNSQTSMSDTSDVSDELHASIPNWIKNNADWWAQGLISDRDFALGLGFMVKEGIIEVENVDVDPEGEIVMDENIIIPHAKIHPYKHVLLKVPYRLRQ